MVGGHHGECGVTGVQGQSPWSGGRSPPEAESIFVIGCPTEPANLAPVRENRMLCYGPLVSELGGGRVHGAPTPSLGGLCPRPPAPPPMSSAYENLKDNNTNNPNVTE